MTVSYSRFDLSEHLRHSHAEYVKCVEQPPRGLSKLQPDTVAVMRDLIPVEGPYYESHKLLRSGDDVAAHTHPEWVALWYADPGSPPHPIIIESESVQPAPGECIVLAPGVEHFVERYYSKHARILFAVLVHEVAP